MTTEQISINDIPISKKIRKLTTQAICHYDMLQKDDRVLIGISGGKDSTVLLLILEEIRKRAKNKFQLIPVMVDQKLPDFNPKRIIDWLKQQGFDLTIIEEDTYSIFSKHTKDGKSICRICSRLRRGILYTWAQKQGINKIALGHHRNDLNETYLMNMFFAGKTASMPPIFHTDKGLTLIRPMSFVPVDMIIELTQKLNFPILPGNLCGFNGSSSRMTIRKLIADMQSKNEKTEGHLLAAQKQLLPDLLADKGFYTQNQKEKLLTTNKL